MDFNERTVVDFPKGTFKYQRRPVKVAKKLKDADRDRVEVPLKAILGTDHEFVNYVGRLLDYLSNTDGKNSYSFFLLTVNANLLAIAIYHLRRTGFFIISNGQLDINDNFEFKKENYRLNGEMMRSTLSKLVVKHEFGKPGGKNYARYATKTIASILRYQRHLVRYFSNILRTSTTGEAKEESEEEQSEKEEESGGEITEEESE